MQILMTICNCQCLCVYFSSFDCLAQTQNNCAERAWFQILMTIFTVNCHNYISVYFSSFTMFKAGIANAITSFKHVKWRYIYCIALRRHRTHLFSCRAGRTRRWTCRCNTSRGRRCRSTCASWRSQKERGRQDRCPPTPRPDPRPDPRHSLIRIPPAPCCSADVQHWCLKHTNIENITYNIHVSNTQIQRIFITILFEQQSQLTD